MNYINAIVKVVIFLIVVRCGAGAQTIELTVANSHVVGATFVFDVYMRATSGTVYLAGSDLVLTFNATNFLNPTVMKAGAETFLLNNTNGDNNTQIGSSVGALYCEYILCSPINSNEIKITVYNLTISDQESFNSDVAKIDNSLYKLGTYTITGLTNASGFMGLIWKTSGIGSTTKVYTYNSSSPWNQTQVVVSASEITDVPLPVEISSFTASANGRRIYLVWATATEWANTGFDVERRISGGTSDSWQAIGFVKGHGTTNASVGYSYRDVVLTQAKYVYRLKQIDVDGKFKYSSEVEVVAALQPEDYVLSSNYPNPFNPTTTFRFALKTEDHVVVSVLNTIGQVVRTLYNGVAASDVLHEIIFDAGELASGQYFYCLKTRDRFEVKRMILIK